MSPYHSFSSLVMGHLTACDPFLNQLNLFNGSTPRQQQLSWFNLAQPKNVVNNGLWLRLIS